MTRFLSTIASAGGHPGPYELALDPTRSTLDTARLVAQRAEAARIDALFVPDLLVFGAQGTIGAQEPLMFVAALSQVTSKAGLIATVSTTFHHPFNLARLFGTLDHLSNGRAAWNLVTSSIGEQNFGPGGLPSPEQRYARAAETIEVVNALWDSWKPGSLRLGPGGKAVLDTSLIKPVNFEGEFFSVEGPINIPPLPQGRPVLIQAGQSAAGIALGARYAEVVFTALATLADAHRFTSEIRAQAGALGRTQGPLIFSSFHATFGASESEAQRLVRERREAIDYEAGRALVADMLGGGVDLTEAKLDEPLPEVLIPDISGINRRRGRAEIFSRLIREGRTLRELIQAAQDTGHWSVAGTPEQLADAVEERFRAGVLDVLSLGGLADDRTHDFVVNGLLHELRKRGIVKDDYRGATLRSNLGLEEPT
ncbi:FMN-dependent oxidoreductase (nitrilotriacetate monooxygenase family) [Actinoplanes lutulentus]|uniref:FMN-dependent oxidoreductase (Nitrilotriacetate monooxygenase family) n=1 Tax=Actinoplanes lutulentus TaxID=1287878 RepID=A0A327ZLI1_9ACTN|nr:NtaA/DmoA family FMN-dependent monooxygenase [Actinoplanes lutulentus]MBB2942696.1 FMN-dependent oxidoreductase (nitrilotriacetate monooxygenase family) [Actinoplanes lutulentus]RAK38277.1 FMN-dependent oxidoreductase (nitrilotriacetate monooxygenase family) [Actinoplanes lutulentus]